MKKWSFVIFVLGIIGSIMIVNNQIAFADKPDVIVFGGLKSEHIEHLESQGLMIESRSLPIESIAGAKLVFMGAQLNTDNTSIAISETEQDELENFVRNGGRLIIAVNTDYTSCNPDSKCGYEFVRNRFGFAFDGNLQRSMVVPEAGQENHPIWFNPHPLSSQPDCCFDAYVGEILDSTNVKVLARISGFSNNPPESGDVKDAAAIVFNDDPSFNGGKVLGGGLTMIAGTNDFRMLDNVIDFMLSELPTMSYDDAFMPEDDQTECRKDLVLVYRINFGDYVCVSQETSEKWIEFGMAELVKTKPGMDKMMDEKTMDMPYAQYDATTSGEVSLPKWIKDLFIWYAEGKVGDREIINAIEFLVNKDIIKISSERQ